MRISTLVESLRSIPLIGEDPNTVLKRQVALLQELVAYVMQTGPRGGRFYYTLKGYKVYRAIKRKTEIRTGEDLETAWKDHFDDPKEGVKALKSVFGDKVPSPKDFEDMYTPDPKYKLKSDVKLQVFGYEVHASFVITDESGERVANAYRSFYKENGKLTVKHDILNIEESQQGKGIGGTLLGQAMKGYKKLGVKKLETYASLDVGLYCWARFGFEVKEKTKFQESLQNLAAHTLRTLREVRKFATKDGKKITGQELDDINRRDADRIAQKAKDIYGVSGSKIKIHGKTHRVGKQTMLDGSSWAGSLDLDNPKSMARFQREVKKSQKNRLKSLESK